MAAILLLAVCLFVGCKKKQPQYGGDIEKQWNATALVENFVTVPIPIPDMQISQIVTGAVLDISNTKKGHLIIAIRVPKLAEKKGMPSDTYFYDEAILTKEIEIDKKSDTEGIIKFKATGETLLYKNLTATSVEFTDKGVTDKKLEVMPSKISLVQVNNIMMEIMGAIIPSM